MRNFFQIQSKFTCDMIITFSIRFRFEIISCVINMYVCNSCVHQIANIMCVMHFCSLAILTRYPYIPQYIQAEKCTFNGKIQNIMNIHRYVTRLFTQLLRIFTSEYPKNLYFHSVQCNRCCKRILTHMSIRMLSFFISKYF